MSAKIIVWLALAGCASRATVVEIPSARPLPSLAPAEIVEDEPHGDDRAPQELTQIPMIDLDDSLSAGAMYAPVARSVCGSGAVLVGGVCLTPAPKPAPTPNGCTLAINSIPSSHVLVDGSYVGQTPQANVNRVAGSHVVTFVTDDASAKKSVSVQCAAGERKTVAVRVRDP